MVKKIKEQDASEGLSPVVAGYAWKWRSKGKDLHDDDLFDIEIDRHKYLWNTTAQDWINSPDSINEIGCIHTVQGYDLNYIGIIFGPEIDYNPNTHKIEVDKGKYYDMLGKSSLKNENELKEYILNIYLTLMTPGIKGAYVYVCNPNLRKYFKEYIDTYTIKTP